MNQLFYGNNLDVLRASIKDETVDLIYLDPPFNSNANYNVLFKSPIGQWTQQRKLKRSRTLGIGVQRPKTPTIKF